MAAADVLGQEVFYRRRGDLGEASTGAAREEEEDGERRRGRKGIRSKDLKKNPGDLIERWKGMIAKREKRERVAAKRQG